MDHFIVDNSGHRACTRAPIRVSSTWYTMLPFASSCPELTSREAVFFYLVSYLLVISCELVSHIHAILLLAPNLPACPPRLVIPHIRLLFDVALYPPPLDKKLLQGLIQAEETLRKGSKSFQVAKLAFGREMRIALVAVYAWCRVTVSLTRTIERC